MLGGAFLHQQAEARGLAHVHIHFHVHALLAFVEAVASLVAMVAYLLVAHQGVLAEGTRAPIFGSPRTGEAVLTETQICVQYMWGVYLTIQLKRMSTVTSAGMVR
jgi:hypothetical protein